MDTINLKEQLSNLLRLQAIDSQIHIINRQKAHIPQEIKVLEDAFESKKQGLADLEKIASDMQKQKKDKESELTVKDEAAKKLQTQLFQLKTNKEYQAMLQQINDSKADSSVIEDKILQLMEQADKIRSDIDAEKRKVQEEEKKFAREKDNLQMKIKEADDRLSQLAAQRKQNIPDIDPKILSQYERILDNRDGLALVGVKNNSCQGCNMFVPPQVINLIKMYEQIVTCEMCNRILYTDD